MTKEKNLSGDTLNYIEEIVFNFELPDGIDNSFIANMPTNDRFLKKIEQKVSMQSSKFFWKIIRDLINKKINFDQLEKQIILNFAIDDATGSKIRQAIESSPIISNEINRPLSPEIDSDALDSEGEFQNDTSNVNSKTRGINQELV